MEIVALAVCGGVSGCFVAVFALWAFLKGLRTGLTVKNGGLPETLFARHENPQEQLENDAPSLAEQFGALLGAQRE